MNTSNGYPSAEDVRRITETWERAWQPLTEAFAPFSHGSEELAGGGEGKSQRVSLAAVRWMKAVLPMGNGRATENEGGPGRRSPGGEAGSAFGACDLEECYDCRRLREGQEAEDVAVWGLLVACLVGFGAAAVSQFWRVLP